MITITLPPEFEQAILECAEHYGTTPELFILDELRTRHLSPPATVNTSAELPSETMAEFFKGYAGTVDSREFVPLGAQLSNDTGKKYKELMMQKHRSGKL
jgi:hypothetical protein